LRLGDLDEDAVIARIAARLERPHPGETWSGDDAAVVTVPGREALFTTDSLVEGVDFQLAWVSGEDVGWKAMAVNASDIAAMGGRPSHAVVTLCVHPATEIALLDGLVDGIIAAGRRWGISLVGGDLSRGRELVVGVAMLGSVGAGAPVLRSTARIGDALCVTGSLGGAAGGLIALRRGASGRERKGAVWRLVERQARPKARVAEGLELAASGATAMIDLSDGLAVDLTRLVAASGVGCEVDPERVPVDADLTGALADGALGEIDARETAIIGGEDFELLFTVDPQRVEEVTGALAPLGCSITRIGVVSHGASRIGDTSLEVWRQRGWDHLRN
jgi:thiamine-monophosphate kinase